MTAVTILRSTPNIWTLNAPHANFVDFGEAPYLNDKLHIWLSFRYFGKTYANLTGVLYFNGRWETFGGVNWSVSKHLDLGCTVVNFLNQKGASGTIVSYMHRPFSQG